MTDDSRKSQQNDREDALRVLLQDPYLKGVAKRLLKKTQSMASQSRKKLRRLQPPKKRNLQSGAIEKSRERLSGNTSKVLDVRPNLDWMAEKLGKGIKSKPHKKRILSMEEAGKTEQTRRIFVNLETEQDLDKIVEQVEKTRKTPLGTRRVILSGTDTKSLEEGLEQVEREFDIKRVKHTPVGGTRKVVVNVDNPDDLEAAIEEIEEIERENPAEVCRRVEKTQRRSGCQVPLPREEEEWMIERISQSIAEAPQEVAEDLISNLKKVSSQRSSFKTTSRIPKIPQDIQQFAAEIAVTSSDLYEAMKEENISSITELYRIFHDMEMAETPLGKPDFSIFVKSLVDSYLDRKNEQDLLGLIGVNSATGEQSLSTTYAMLFAEIFRPEIGGFFLKSGNPNYNAFNIANLIQEQLIGLDEMTRVSYLENLLSLLYERDMLLANAKNVVNETLRDKYFVKIFPDPEYLFSQLAKYFADLAIFCLGSIAHDELPGDIGELLPQDIYECIGFVWGFPKNLLEKNAKVIYMLRQLAENNPMVFNVK